MKNFLITVFILLFTLTTGCSTVSLKENSTIKPPKNNNILVEGNWIVEEIKLIDEKIEINKEEKNKVKKVIKIKEDKISILNKDYEKVNYKLKVVNNDYMLSYEFNFKLKDILANKDKIDVISIISSNKIIGEFILEKDNYGYLYYQGILFKLKKSEKEINYIENKEIFKTDYKLEDYNSSVGVMLALKSTRQQLEDYSYSEESYRTLWISFKDNEINPILQKDYIIFPRMKGIWNIKSNIIKDNNNYIEYFTTNKIDSLEDNNTSNNIQNNTTDIYKNITFISNDYISMEIYQGEDFKNQFPIYKTIPIDNINSEKGLSIKEIYSEDGKKQYEKDFNVKLESLKINSDINPKIDYSNFKIDRLEGKWILIGNIPSVDNEYNQYRININPVDKILNYDRLLISWKELRSNFPLIKDAYTSPNGRLAIIVLDNNLLVYEIEEDNINLNLLAEINIEENEEVIMAEWANGSYVDYWENAFKN
ncbi:hypothetical protein [Clostridium sp.]|uniref:hypothetical protein n=1 Tax=Clostridium sp. TaxID=1506 RepID=UPI0026051F13|nr:hypothetical protein [Clostridium sp.]